jgi:hypothetical protein
VCLLVLVCVIQAAADFTQRQRNRRHKLDVTERLYEPVETREGEDTKQSISRELQVFVRGCVSIHRPAGPCPAVPRCIIQSGRYLYHFKVRVIPGRYAFAIDVNCCF